MSEQDESPRCLMLTQAELEDVRHIRALETQIKELSESILVLQKKVLS